MYWRYVLGLWGIVTTPITLLFAIVGAWIAVLVINLIAGIIVAASYLYALWLSYRPGGGPVCTFAVTPDGAHYHAGDELRNLGQALGGAATAMTGNPQHVLTMQAAQSSNDLFIPWAKVKSIEILPAMRLVFVSRGLYGPIPLFCTPENFDAVRRYALAHAPQARVCEQNHPQGH